MGQNDFYPLYLSIGNVRNIVRRAHWNAVALIGFLAIPKSKSSKFINVFGSYLSGTHQQQKTEHWSTLLQIQEGAFSYCTHSDPWEPEAWHDCAQGCMMCRWSLLACHIQHWTLHCRLQEASRPCRNCLWMVQQVSVSSGSTFGSFSLWIIGAQHGHQILTEMEDHDHANSWMHWLKRSI